MISVIIPMYNREKTIVRAIQSVLNQKQKDGFPFKLQVIVVDDCSTDNSVARVLEFNDSRVQLVRLEQNSGANIARNRGIMEAQGEYVAFHDSDDEWLPDKLWKQLEFLQAEQADLVSCGMVWRGEKGAFELHHKSGSVQTTDLVGGNFLSTQTLLMKREILETVRFDEALPRLQDWELVFRLSLQYKLTFLDEVLVAQYATENSISRNSKAKLEAIQMIEGKFQALYPMTKKEQALFFLHLSSLADADVQMAKYYLRKSLASQLTFQAMKAWLRQVVQH